MSVAHSDVLKPETNPTDLLTSAEHIAAPSLAPVDAPSAVQRPWEEDQPEDISASSTHEQHRWASPTSMDFNKSGFGRCQADNRDSNHHCGVWRDLVLFIRIGKFAVIPTTEHGL